MRCMLLLAGLLIAAAASADTSFYTVKPCRLESSYTLVNGTNGPIKVKGRCSVPTTAKAVVLNLTVTDAADPNGALILIYDAGVPEPATSSLNWNGPLEPGKGVANNALVRLESSHYVNVRAALDPGTSAQLFIDVAGYFE